jgi:hypothetical protein
VCDVCHARWAAQRHVDGNKNESDHEVLGFNRERERKQHDLAIGVDDAERQQYPVDPPGRSDRRNRWIETEQTGVRDGDCDECRADDAEEIELEEALRAPVHLELRTEHPEREHVEQDVTEAIMKKRVSDDLVHVPVGHHLWNEREQRGYVSGGRRASGQRCEYEDYAVDDEQPLDRLGERREAQRHRVGIVVACHEAII